MYYLRADQAALVTPEHGSVDPVKDVTSIRSRFPFPDEDKNEPGNFDPFERSIHVFILPSLRNPRIILTNVPALAAKVRLYRPEGAPTRSAAPPAYDPLRRVAALERPCHDLAALAAPYARLGADVVFRHDALSGSGAM